MLTPEQLSKLAEKQAQSHAQKALTGDLTVTTNSVRRDWDGTLMRHVHHQTMTIWRKYGRFDIILDTAGKLVGFVDHDKFLEPGDQVLDREEALDLIRKAGVVPEDARLEEFGPSAPPSGIGRTWKAVFGLHKAEPDYDLLDVEINAAKKTIASVRPKRREARRA